MCWFIFEISLPIFAVYCFCHKSIKYNNSYADFNKKCRICFQITKDKILIEIKNSNFRCFVIPIEIACMLDVDIYLSIPMKTKDE